MQQGNLSPDDKLFKELHVPCTLKPVTILTDSQTALDISENPVNYHHAKPIDIRYHAVRYYIRDEKIEIDYIPPNYQPADIFTKALGPSKTSRILSNDRFTQQLRSI